MASKERRAPAAAATAAARAGGGAGSAAAGSAAGDDSQEEQPQRMEDEGEGEAEIRPWQMHLCNFFLISVILRLPFFEVECGKGICKSPLEVVAVELYAYGRAPHALIRALLYPGAFSDGLQRKMLGEVSASAATCNWTALLDEYKNVTVKHASQQPFPRSWEMVKEQRLDLVGGSFIVAVGALMAAFGPNVGSSVGMALLLVFVLRGKALVHTYMYFAFACSLAWVPLHRLKGGGKSTPPRKAAQAPSSDALKQLRTRGKFKVY